MRSPNVLVITGVYLLALAVVLGGAMLTMPELASGHHRPGHSKGPKPRPTPTATASVTAAPPTATATASPSASPSTAPTSTPTTAPTSTPTTAPTATPTPTTTASATPSAAPAGFVQVSGTNLTLNGQPYRFVGTNAYNLASGWKTLWQCSYNAQQDLDRQFDEMVNVEAIRFWAFQRFATFNGQRNWEAFDRIIAEAKSRGVKLVPTLGNHWGDCETQGGSRSDSWYSTGYKTELRGDIATFRAYVAEFVTRYKDEPTIAIVQLLNEAEASPTSLRAFATDMANVVKAIDTNHVLSLGTIGGGQNGASGGDYKTLHAINGIDICEYHDYSDDNPIPGDQWNGMQVRIDQCNELGKPLFVGEIGRIPDQVGGVQARSNLFKAKFDAWFAAGVDGAQVWNFHDSQHPDPPSSYGINAGDPVWTMLGGY